MRNDDVWRHVDHQRADLADFLDGLTPEQWTSRSLCHDWTVRDVAAHLTQSTTNWPRFGVEAVRVGFRFDHMVSQLARRDRRAPDEITAALRDMVGVRRRPPGTKVADPLMDVLVHGQDIARPLGLARTMPAEAAVASAERLWGMTFPLHPRRRFPGVRFVATDVDFAVGHGPRISGTITDIVMALAGREAALDQLADVFPATAGG